MADADIIAPEEVVPDQAQAASEAREAATLPRQRVNKEPLGPPSPKEEAIAGRNYFDQFDGDPKDDGVALAERGRLNRQEAYYRGSLAGASRLQAMSYLAENPDPPDTSPERKKVNDDLRKEFTAIKADLAAYDLMKPWETTLEATVAFGNQLLGTMVSPESWLGWGAKGATALIRTLKAGAQQGAIQASVDPAIQALNLASGVQEEFDPLRTLASAGMGVAIGGGMHAAGEGLSRIIGPLMERQQLFDLSRQDPAFESAWMQREAMWRLSPETGAQLALAEGARLPEPTPGENFLQYVARAGLGDELVKARRGEPTSPEFQQAHDAYLDWWEKQQEVEAAEKAKFAHSFQETVSAEKKRLADSYGATQPRSARLNEEARFAAFEKEAGPQAEALLSEYGLDRETAHDLYMHYNRAAGETPQDALIRAVDQWADARERAAMQDLANDSEWVREMDDLNRHFAAEAETWRGGGSYTDWRGNVTVFPELTRYWRNDAAERRAAEWQAAADREKAGAGGRTGEGGQAAPREGGATTGGGEGAAGSSGPGVERAAPAEGVRGERLGGPQEALGEPRAQSANATARDKKVTEAFAKEITPERIARAREGAPDFVREEIDMLVGMGADKGMASSRDTMRLYEIVRDRAPGTEAPKTERTAQGEQVLIPGVEPITDHQRIEAQAGKPLEGGNAPPPAGGLFDEGARAQGSMFLSGIPDEQELARRRKGGTLNNEQRRDAAGVEGPRSPAEETAVRSLQQQVTDLVKAMGIPLHEGRVTKRDALGFYKTKYGVARIKEYPDFEVAVHEIAHGLEAKIGNDLTDLTQRYAFEMMPLDYDQGPQGRRVHEGLAEWVRMYVGNPAFAEQAAPNFTQDFRLFMQAEHPEILANLDKAAAAYRAYLDAPSVDAVGVVRRSRAEHKEGFAKVRETVREEGLPFVIKSAVQHAYTAIFDNKAPVTRVVRDLSKAIKEKTGALVDLKAADNPDVLLRLAERSQQEAVVDMMQGVVPYHDINPSGPSLADALAYATGERSVWGKWDPEKKSAFSEYLIARRAEYLWRKFEAGDLPNPPAAFSKADALVAMAEWEAKHPNFKDASDMVHVYANELLRKRFEGNIIDRDLYDKLIAEEFYVPFMRDMSDKPGAEGSVGRVGSEGPGNAQTVMRMKGSSRDIMDPIESLMLQTFLVNRTIRQNDVVLSMVRLAERAGREGGRYVEPIPSMEAKKYTADVSAILEQKALDIGMTPTDARDWAATIGSHLGEDPIVGSYFKMEQANAKGEPIIFYKEGGELRAARFMSEKDNGGQALYEILTAAPTPITDVWVQLVGASATLLRSAITTNPTFIISNYIRDQVAAAILRPDYIPLVSGLKGIHSEVTQGQAARLYSQAGGVAGGAATGPVEHAVNAEIDALAKNGYLVNRLTSFKGLLELASITEAGTRNSIFATVYDAKIRQGLSPYEAMVEAAFNAQDILDFSRHGSHTLVIRKLLPFVNAHMQGLDKAYRTMIDPIVNRIREGEVFAKDSAEFNNALLAWAKAGAAGSAMGAFWAAINWDKESYQDASPYLKGTHFVVPLGNKIIVVPKPFELSMGFTLGEYAFQAMMADKPQAARQFIEAAWHSMQPPNPLTDVPLLSSAMSAYTGKNMMTGNDIVPDTMQRLPAELQYNDRTSELAKWIGREIGVSPMKVDYAIGANFGNWGRDIMALSQGVNEDSPAKSFDDSIFLRRFVKDPTRANNVATKFWEFMGQTTGKYNQAVAGYDALVKGFKDETGEAQNFISKLPDGERAFVTLKSAADANGKPAFSPDERRLHPLQRSYDAVTLLNNMRKELSDNTFKDFQTVQRLKLDPEKRRDLIENLRELSQMEMRNALVILKEPGWEGRPVLDPNDVMDKIRALSPEVANEVSTRYATAKIYTTTAIQAAWPQTQAELVRAGSRADIRGAAYEARAGGYEFGGIRVRRPPKRRVEIQGTQ